MKISNKCTVCLLVTGNDKLVKGARIDLGKETTWARAAKHTGALTIPRVSAFTTNGSSVSLWLPPRGRPLTLSGTSRGDRRADAVIFQKPRGRSS